MHHWQDLVLTIGLIAFDIALLASVFGKQKPSFATSGLTTVFLVPQLIVYISLNLWISFSLSLLNTLLWLTLAIQGYRLRTKKLDDTG